eukprot:260014-Amphidinium_carterae.1
MFWLSDSDIYVIAGAVKPPDIRVIVCCRGFLRTWLELEAPPQQCPELSQLKNRTHESLVLNAKD